jgi:hypothetical protein
LNAELEERIALLIEDYVRGNSAARTLRTALNEAGVGLRPIVDHLTLRTFDVDRRARAFMALGYRYDETLEYDDWFAKVYRCEGFPALFVDQAYPDARGRDCPIVPWVERFGDAVLHHAAILVEDIDIAVSRLRGRGVEFAGEVVGPPGAALRQIFSLPEIRDGAPFSVLELTERHHGYRGFSPPQANALMQSTRRERS